MSFSDGMMDEGGERLIDLLHCHQLSSAVVQSLLHVKIYEQSYNLKFSHQQIKLGGTVYFTVRTVVQCVFFETSVAVKLL